ncbi:unnamed protein product [Prunus armeniaca]|uniref:Uncharacterized protein n=1 Tax=Prunus armeniaca TaxID=36596 RepID=A0A6J5XST2_PRUAR|nr:unnamed protein product [Prunus armeniaca]
MERKWGMGYVCFWGKEKERNDGLIEMKFYIDLQFQPEMLRWRVRGEGGRCNGHSLFLFSLSKETRERAREREGDRKRQLVVQSKEEEEERR